MRRYVLKKIALILPSLLALSILVFFLSKLAPGDPVINLIELRGEVVDNIPAEHYDDIYSNVAKELNLHLPTFYFSISPAAYPDTLYRFVNADKKKAVKELIHNHPDWPGWQEFFHLNKAVKQELLMIEDSLKNSDYDKLLKNIQRIEQIPAKEEIIDIFNQIKNVSNDNDDFNSQDLQVSIEKLYQHKFHIDEKKEKAFTFFPILKFHGFKNQYHEWLVDVLKLDFGTSMVDAQDVSKKISSSLIWTFLYVLCAYIISLFISIPLGLYSGWKHPAWIEKIISNTSFIFYAFPLFWLATLAVVFLTNDLYSEYLNIFPSIGLGNIYSNMSLAEKVAEALPHLILPALILALHSAAQGIRIIRNSTLSELKSDYYLTARAKGLSGRRIIWKHIFPNAMLPVITMLVSSFPAALAGSVVLEVIFNIPGLGRLLFDSINLMDWNVVFAILLFIGLITFIFYLLGDILYALLNPKIRYS